MNLRELESLGLLLTIEIHTEIEGMIPDWGEVVKHWLAGTIDDARFD